MPCYLVRWEIDIDAESPREAAEQARAIQQRPDNAATFYEVTAPDGDPDDADKRTLVDLDTGDA